MSHLYYVPSDFDPVDNPAEVMFIHRETGDQINGTLFDIKKHVDDGCDTLVKLLDELGKDYIVTINNIQVK
jgi:hypothetical protein